MTMPDVVAAYSPPEIPNKFDIIPIHNSDRGAFKRCRRYWDWSSPARNNLTIRADIHGINTNLWFGTGIHYALQQYYTPGLQRDPVEVFKTWFDIQWRGGVVTEDWLDLVYDLKPQPMPYCPDCNSSGVTGPELFTCPKCKGMGNSAILFKVRGLMDIIPDPDHFEFDELRELGIDMMEFYKQYAEKNDDFDVLVSEHNFSVPIWDYENDRILKAIDSRDDSPNFGYNLEVHARGRMDMLYVRHGADRLGIMDHKTADKIGDDYFVGLDMDEQAVSYAWAAEVEAKYYDLPYAGQSVEEVVFNVMRKHVPKPPTILKSGMFSVNRAEESCTYDMLTDYIKKNLPHVGLTEKQYEYLNWLREVGDKQFIIRHPVRLNKAKLYNAGQRLYMEALDMLEDPRIYPNITKDFRCLRCQFRTPCVALEEGSDYKQLLTDNYTKNKDR